MKSDSDHGVDVILSSVRAWNAVDVQPSEQKQSETHKKPTNITIVKQKTMHSKQADQQSSLSGTRTTFMPQVVMMPR